MTRPKDLAKLEADRKHAAAMGWKLTAKKLAAQIAEIEKQGGRS